MFQIDAKSCERARLTRDARFDGLFFTGVLSTGIFCRPICPAPAPKPEHVVYFATAAAATQAGLRPCLRCRPESAPGTPAWNGTSATVARAMALIRQGALNQGDVENLAARLGVGGRHLRRLFKQHIGASPLAIAMLQRVFFAKQLLSETDWPITRIALSCGFGSIRRFNAGFQKIYGQSPTSLRRKWEQERPLTPAAFQCTLRLPYRPPYDWARMLAFFRARTIPGVETVDEAVYRRTFRIAEKAQGFIRIRHAPKGHALNLEIEISDSLQLMAVVERVRRMFDLNADMEAIQRTLATDPLLAGLLGKLKGLRLPGSWDPFETAVRAVVGQQVSIKAARTIAGRIAQQAGPVFRSDAADDLTHFFPTAGEIIRADLGQVGMTTRRLATLTCLAGQVAAGELDLSIRLGLPELIRRLTEIPGIGAWTAHYIALRGIGEPDAFPAGDLGIARSLMQDGTRLSASRIRARAEAWRPWRAYAATLLWNA